MSGGHFNYKQYEFGYIADEIEQIIRDNDTDRTDRHGDSIAWGYPPEIIEKFKDAVLTIRRAQIMAHRIDWLVSCDDGPDTFIERLEKDLMALERL